MQVLELWVYPIKSCGGFSVNSLSIDERGPALDREWMIVDAAGNFLTQREFPKLAQIQTQLSEDQKNIQVLVGQDIFNLPIVADPESTDSESQQVTVQIWGQSLRAGPENQALSKALSEFLQKPVTLVRYSKWSQRYKNQILPDFKPETQFSDGMPLLLFSTASLNDLNQRLMSQGQSAVPASRFRGNLIFSADQPWIEDQFQKIQIGSVRFSQSKPCARCVVITIDQRTGEKKGPEPLKTLSTFRREGNKVLFGQQLIPENSGVIKVGDQIIL